MSVKLIKDNDIIIYTIDKEANTFEIEMARKGFEKKNQTLGLIRDGDDIFTCSYPVQTMYEFNQNDNNYTLSTSSDIVKVRTLEKKDDLWHENIISLNYKNEEYCVTKYIHTLKRSTIEAMTYSSVDGGNLSDDDAKEIIISSLKKIKSFNTFDKYIDMNKLVLFFKELNAFSK